MRLKSVVTAAPTSARCPVRCFKASPRSARATRCFLLDEIDKLGTDFRGDPSSALLEVLDPEQNHTFGDHYVEVDFDLSDVMFVATSNSMNIPPALLDRMEVIRLSGYTEDEKTSIAMKYLLPKQLGNNGLNAAELDIREDAVRDIVRYYTREAGVRSLEREVSKICRKVVKGLLLKKYTPQVVVDADNLGDFLGVRKYTFGRAEQQNQVGQVVGLAWTEVGGDLLTIEAALMPGKGTITRTGSLGDVMKESVEAARTVVRSRSRAMGIKDELFEKARRSHPCARRCHPQRRPQCRCRHGHCIGIGNDRYPCAR
jgi:ATP-dependent Lon protease